MKAGRKNLPRAVNERGVVLSEGQSIVQAVSVRGSNMVEVMDARGNKLLALLPAKFQKTLWVGRGSFVVVDDSGKEKALESGSKVGCIVLLFHEQVCELSEVSRLGNTKFSILATFDVSPSGDAGQWFYGHGNLQLFCMAV